MTPVEIPADQIHYDLTGPCSDCPFRTDAAYHAGVFLDLPELSSALKEASLIHTCHKTHPVADGFQASYTGPIQHCGGLLAMMAKDINLVCAPQVQATRGGRWKPRGMDPSAPVFESFGQMARHYAARARDYLAKQREKERG